MLCVVFVFRYLMQLSNEYSLMLLLCSRCGKVLILNVFKTGFNAVSFLPVFKLCYWCFQQSSGGFSTRAPRLSPSLRLGLQFILEKASLLCFVYLCHHPRSYFTKLLTQAFLLGLVTVHIFLFHVWPFTIMLQVT